MRLIVPGLISPFYTDLFRSPPPSGESNCKLTLQPGWAIEAAKDAAHGHRDHIRFAHEVLENPEKTRAAHKRQRRAERYVSKCLGVRWTVTPESHKEWLRENIPF